MRTLSPAGHPLLSLPIPSPFSPLGHEDLLLLVLLVLRLLPGISYYCMSRSVGSSHVRRFPRETDVRALTQVCAISARSAPVARNSIYFHFYCPPVRFQPDSSHTPHFEGAISIFSQSGQQLRAA
ncbi:hypothetical protein BaRGS_00023676 [Batillaria attramentaria]|uniref:Secreted protein n=1 Tax=Batillaria attramentaria TaxID=370345 RepID=A0ABD0KDB5_9CAEN